MNKQADAFRQNLIFHRRSRLWRNFGFIPNLNLSVKKNLDIIEYQRSKDDVPQIQNKAFHNLCTGNVQPPDGVADVLGLGLNYCIESPLPTQGQDECDTLQRPHRDTRLFWMHNKIGQTDDDDNTNANFEPSLYVPRNNYIPDIYDPDIEAQYCNFESALTTRRNQLSRTKRYNLTSHNRYCIRELKNRKDLITGFTDKNLGPFIARRDHYIKEFLNEHLLKSTYYRLLTEEEKNRMLADQKKALTDLLAKYRQTLPESHQQYFDRSLEDIEDNDGGRIPQIYGCPKVHKGTTSKRPVVSCCGSLPQVFSTYVDFWLKRIVQSLLPSYMKNADTLIDKLNTAFPHKIPTGAKLFSIDAVGMYSNIDTKHGIEVVNTFFNTFSTKIPDEVPTVFLRECLDIIMQMNVI